jgi:hypothetical protein
MNAKGIFPVLLLIGLAGAAKAQTEANFSGTWMMDSTRSESVHQDVPTKPLIITIAMTGDGMTLETAHQENAGKAVDESIRVKLDGSESTTVANGTSIKAKARWDGRELIVDTARQVSQATVTTHYIYALDPQAHELTVDKTLTVQHGYEGIQDQGNEAHGKDVFIRALQ